MRKMFIEINNCNSIDCGKIEIIENTLNIFYAINGTGKSTIARAISAKNDTGLMEKLRPFKYRGIIDEAYQPHVAGVDSISSIDIFDEKYVSQYVFKTEEIIQNSFEIFIKTPDYEQQLQIIDELIKETRNTFSQNPELDELMNDFTVFIDGFGKAQSGYSAAGALGKGLGRGNKVYNIPDGLAPYKNYIQNSVDGANAKWIKWHLTGNEFIGVTHQCPYCATETTETIKQTILKVSEEFDPKAIEHLNKMLEVFDRLKNYFSENTNMKIEEISKNISGISFEQKTYLLQIKEQVAILKDKLWKIKTMNFTSLKDVDKIVNEISSYKVNLSYLEHLDSTYSQDKIVLINAVLDAILIRATELQAAVGRQNSTIKKIINDYSKEINSFLKYAGYNYTVSLKDDGQGSYKLRLQSKDLEGALSEADSHLSFGERNAFALVLFMYQALKSNPDLIILDDPISSFDGNKKYAILYKLFKEKRSFKDKTVILLTHEFGTIIDTIYNMPHTIKANAKHLENKKGQLIEKIIDREKIHSFPMIAKANIELSAHKINKLIYLRRLLEVENQKGDEWQLLSNIFKDGRATPIYLLEDGTSRAMTQNEIEGASSYISDYIEDFDYTTDYILIQDKDEIVRLYMASTSNYEKLQLYRIINNSNSSNNVIKKFVNETFHIENDYLFQLNPLDFEMVPQYVIDACDADIKQIYPDAFLSNASTSCSQPILFTEMQGNKRKVRLFDMPASAGTGHWFDTDTYSDILIDDFACDFAVKISGDSMEPQILGGSIVLAKFDPNIKHGDIGIFNLNGEIFCKQLGQNSLISLNGQYNPIQISEYDDLRPQGKIVKIIKPTSISYDVEFV